ncbi:MvdC/MvdD family ATP grasp protein [Amycolatopsis sp. NPDC004079]|uniref:MvdC/MvdD family ATP grasp protein n=1 Tax=Amycolatopsis sp. NPDC004079 TaxID=3154549 RepID=UPI0033A03C79
MNTESRPGAGTVLVLTEPGDTAAGLVVAELHRLGERTLWLDPGDFPLAVEVSAYFDDDGGWSGEIRGPDGSASLRDVRGVYVRRPSSFVFPAQMTDAARRYAEREARRGFVGLLLTLDSTWVNHPARVADAEYKPVQYAVAAECGLAVPRTVVTNAPRAAAAHRAHLGPARVHKTLASPTVVDGDKLAHVFTTPAADADVGDAGVALTAHQFQQRVPKTRDVRAIVVGDRVFAANIHGDQLDWRADYDALSYEPTTLPPATEAGLLRMTARLGISFAAADFAVDAKERHWFLDLNPNGQWDWIQDATGLPIAAAIAAELTADRGPRPVG